MDIKPEKPEVTKAWKCLRLAGMIRGMKPIAAVFVAVMLAACGSGGGGGGSPAAPAAPDTTPPSVLIGAPSDIREYSTSTTMVVPVSLSGDDIKTVSWGDETGQKGTVSDFGFSAVNNRTWTFTYGEHSLWVEAADKSGNVKRETVALSLYSPREFTGDYDLPAVGSSPGSVQISAYGDPYDFSPADYITCGFRPGGVVWDAFPSDITVPWFDGSIDVDGIISGSYSYPDADDPAWGTGYGHAYYEISGWVNLDGTGTVFLDGWENRFNTDGDVITHTIAASYSSEPPTAAQ